MCVCVCVCVFLLFRSYRQCLAEVFVPVVEKVIAAPDASPLSGIDVTNMADFMIQLTQPTQPNVHI